MGSGEITSLTKASPKAPHSLRTTVPQGIVKQFNLKQGDKLDWMIEARDGQLIVVVKKVKAKK